MLIKKKKRKKIIALIPVRGKGFNETLVALKLQKKPIIFELIDELKK